MQKSISRTVTAWRYILAGFLIVSLISCEEENSVGGEFIGGSKLKFDTLFVDNFTPQNDEIFSGNLQFTPVGIYNDPLFGNTKSNAFIKPQISALNFEDEVDDSYQLKLELITNSGATSGNTMSSVNFDIFPVTEFWRGNEVVSNDAISIDSTKSFGSFTHFSQDTLIIDLSNDLLLELATYINNDSSIVDSLYDFDFDGMAIVPRSGSSKIIFPDMFESRFVIISPEEDTTRFVTKSHAFNIERSNANNYQNRLYINSYFENFYSLSFESALPNYDQINLLKAEFIVYEDVDQLNNSLPNSHSRTDVSSLELKSADAANLRYDLQFTGTEFFGAADSLNDSFRFDLTEHINQFLFTEPDEKTLYFNLNPSGGIMRSTLLYDQTSVDSLRPKLILTFSE